MDWKKIVFGVATGAALVTAGLVGAALDKPDVIVKQVEVLKEVPLIVTETVVQEVVKEVEVEKIVLVEDEESLSLMCNKLMYDDISECKEEVGAEDAALKLALSLLDDEAEVFDLLEDEGFIKDEDKANIIKVYDDFDDIVILNSDFDDQEYKFEVKVKVEDEKKDVKKYVWFKLAVEDGEAEIVKVWE